MILIIKVEAINEANLSSYKDLIINRVEFEKGDTLVYGAKYGDIPCGAILVQLKGEDEKLECEITSFFVLEFFRKKGAGTKLLTAIKNKLKQLNVKKIRVNAVTAKKNIDLLESFLLKRGFSKAKLLTEVYLFDPKVQEKKNKFIQTILNSNLNLPDKIEILTKEKVQKELLEKVKNKDGIDYPENLSPFANEYNLEDKLTQFAIYDNKEIVGWLTALKTSGNSILYRSLFVKEEYRNLALGYYLFNSAIKLHGEKCFDRYALYAVELENVNAQKFCSRYFKDFYESKKYEFEIIGEI